MTFDPAVIPIEKFCTKCKENYRQEFFSFDASNEGRRCVCIGCDWTARDQRKQRDRILQKVRDTIRRHAQKLGISRDRLMHYYGWTVDRLHRECLEACEKVCGYCEKPFLKGVLNDVTLDIVNPDDEPFYSYNVKWVCHACNRAKQRTAAAVFAIRLTMWKRWHARQAKLKAMPSPPLPPEPSTQWLPGLAPA